jgi:hypothetical protein
MPLDVEPVRAFAEEPGDADRSYGLERGSAADFHRLL